jgi:hypothetical protein
MKSFVEKITDPDFGDKLIVWFSLYGFGFVTGMLVFENTCR